MKRIAVFFTLFAGFAAAGEALTSVADAQRIPLEELTKPRPFDFTGTVLIADTSWCIFSDSTGGIMIFHERPLSSGMKPWDFVRVTGEMLIFNPDKSRRFVSSKIETLRHGVTLPPVDASAKDVEAGRFDFKFVRMKGVLSSLVKDEVAPNYTWARLRTADGDMMLTINQRALHAHSIKELTDAEVEVAGLSTPVSGLRRSLGRSLRVYDAGDIRVIAAPPEDPFAAPLLSDDTIAQHRQRTSGDVIAISRNAFFLRTDIGRIIKVVPVPEVPLPHVGDAVIAAGFPKHVPYQLSLAEAIVKVSGKSRKPVEKPHRVGIAELFTDNTGQRCFNTRSTGNFLSLQGKVKSATDDELELSDGENTIFVMIGAARDRLGDMPEVGSVVEATGLCWSEFHNNYESDIYPAFLRFTLYPHDAGDIRVIASPPWWTPFRLAALVLLLAALLAVSFAWNLAVNRKAERRGRELYEERASHAIAEKKVEERTRLAVELHDSLSQTLTGIAMQLEVGNNSTAQTMLAACRSDLRRCLWDLRSRTFEEKDMTEAIERTLAPHSVGAKMSVRFNVPRERLSDSLMHAILHIVRELVVNAIRHGKAKEIKIAGECHGGTISFSVKDNGFGFDPSAAPGPAEGHFGLLGIRERLKSLHGTITIESRPGSGTRAMAVIKLPDSPARPSRPT